MDNILLLSGGLDSVFLFKSLKNDGIKFRSVFFDYGQNHISEKEFAKKQDANLIIKKIEISKNERLTSGKEIKTSKDSVVEYRNALFIIEASRIIKEGCIFLGCNKEDYSEYVDCRSEFIDLMNLFFKVHKKSITVKAPLINMSKSEITMKAKEFNISINDFFSCYNGNNCGTCPACSINNREWKGE